MNSSFVNLDDITLSASGDGIEIYHRFARLNRVLGYACALAGSEASQMAKMILSLDDDTGELTVTWKRPQHTVPPEFRAHFERAWGNGIVGDGNSNVVHQSVF